MFPKFTRSSQETGQKGKYWYFPPSLLPADQPVGGVVSDVGKVDDAPGGDGEPSRPLKDGHRGLR